MQFKRKVPRKTLTDLSLNHRINCQAMKPKRCLTHDGVDVSASKCRYRQADHRTSADLSFDVKAAN